MRISNSTDLDLAFLRKMFTWIYQQVGRSTREPDQIKIRGTFSKETYVTFGTTGIANPPRRAMLLTIHFKLGVDGGFYQTERLFPVIVGAARFLYPANKVNTSRELAEYRLPIGKEFAENAEKLIEEWRTAVKPKKGYETQEKRLKAAQRELENWSRRQRRANRLVKKWTRRVNAAQRALENAKGKASHEDEGNVAADEGRAVREIQGPGTESGGEVCLTLQDAVSGAR